MHLKSFGSLAVVVAALSTPARAGDWNNNGGTPRRDGLSSETGPDAFNRR